MKSNTFNLKSLREIKGGGAAIVALLFLSVFLWITFHLNSEGLHAFDMSFINQVHSRTAAPLTLVAQTLSFIGEAKAVACYLGLLFILALLSRMPMTAWVKIAGVTAISASLTEIIKKMVHRERPTFFRLGEATGFSFPSGHSMNGVVFWGMLLFYLYDKNQRKPGRSAVFLLFAFPLMVALSRIYLGVHYPSDVIAGLCLGFSVLFFARGILTPSGNERIRYFDKQDW